MKKEKLSLSSIKNVLSRAELKKIMAGCGTCQGLNASCSFFYGDCCPNKSGN